MAQDDDIDHSAPGFDLSSHWQIDPAITFLNHGSFGATPTRVLTEQAELRRKMEREPVSFFVRDLPLKLDRARAELADFVGAEPPQMAFVPNATSGVNAVLRSLELSAGDELLTTDQAYPACKNALDFVAERSGAEVVVVDMPFPLESSEEIVERVMDVVGDQTRLALLDHIASPTGLILPVERLVDELGARGVDTLVDGAHAPGMLPLDLETLGATYYVGNCHKWLCAPKGAGFLWVDKSRRDVVRPTVISHGASAPKGERFHFEFDWTGTHDVTPYLCVPTAISFLRSLMPGGWQAIYKRNHELAIRARDLLCETLECDPPAPDHMLGSMAAVRLPDADYDELEPPLFLDPLGEKLLSEARFEVRVVAWPRLPKRLIRVSCQLYNTLEQYEELCAILPDALAGEPLLEEGELPVY